MALHTETINQAYLFLIFILNGILIGAIFDIFRILRRSFPTPNIITYIEDIAFWILSGITFMYNVFTFNNGEFRAYIFVGLILGIMLYMLLFSKIVMKLSVRSNKYSKKDYKGNNISYLCHTSAL